jgi:hypothetical protein
MPFEMYSLVSSIESIVRNSRLVLGDALTPSNSTASYGLSVDSKQFKVAMV